MKNYSNFAIVILFLFTTMVNSISANCCINNLDEQEQISTTKVDCHHHQNKSDKNDETKKSNKHCSKQCCQILTQFEIIQSKIFYPTSFEIVILGKNNMQLRLNFNDSFRPPIA